MRFDCQRQNIFFLVFIPLFHQIRAQSYRPAIRVRLNHQVFDQASKIVQGLVEYEVPRVTIPPTRQCFTEGCIDAHSFRMSSFRQPTFVAFEPYFPNKFRIRVTDFDFVVTGQLSGTITVILNIPISGSIVVTGRSIGVSALIDLQKTVNDQPYLRFTKCQIDGGVVAARVSNMGLLTDTVNQKFGNILSGQSRSQLEDAICQNMNRLTQLHFSTRLSRIPKSISARELFEIVISENVKKTDSTANLKLKSVVREKRATSDDYYDDVEKTDGPAPKSNSPSAVSLKKIELTRNDVMNFFNIERLSHIMIDLTLLDAASTNSDFSLGISGNVFSSRSQGQSPYIPPYPFKIPQNENRKMVEVIVSKYSLNSLLYQAHRTNSLLFHVDSKTPGVGNLLKTSCSLDEVCISDEVPKIKSLYPDRTLELIIRSSESPIVKIDTGTMTISMSGRCIFFIEGTRKKIGVIPFDTIVLVAMKTVGNKLEGNVLIKSLEFAKDLSFLGLSNTDLNGLRKTTKNALQNFINSATSHGFTLSTSSIRSPLRLLHPQISFLPNALLLQADVDLYRTLYTARKS